MDRDPELRSLVKDLFAFQRFAVLATQSEGQPYGNLVGFAATGDLKNLLFVTPRNTTKFKNLATDGKVAVLVDSRTDEAFNLETGVAVTVIGNAVEAGEDEREQLLGIYLARHPALADFAHGPGNALVKVVISHCIVAGFNNVRILRQFQ